MFDFFVNNYRKFRFVSCEWLLKKAHRLLINELHSVSGAYEARTRDLQRDRLAF